MNKTILTIAIIATLSAAPVHAFWGGGGDEYNEYNTTNNHGGKGGHGGDATAGAAAGAIAGAAAGAHAGANAVGINHNSNRIGVGVSNSTRNTNVGINRQGQALHNTNLIGGSSQSLGNFNDLSNRNGQDQGQFQDQAQGQRQSQGNKQNMTYNEAKQDYSNTYEDYVAPAYAPSIQPSAPCAIPVSAGFTLPAIGSASGGTAYVEEGCVLRETVRIGLSSQNPATVKLADAVLQSKLQEYKDEADRLAIEELKEEAAEEKRYKTGKNDFWGEYSYLDL